MTLLGIGNTIGDLFVDAALSIQGFDVMAITGCFVGQMSNLMVGFSLFCIIGYAKGTLKTFQLYDTSRLFVDQEMTLLFSI